MVINFKSHLSQRFISREPGFNIVVIFDGSFPEVSCHADEIVDLELRYQSVYFVKIDNVWNSIIEEILCNPCAPIYVLNYQEEYYTASFFDNLVHLDDYLHLLIANHMEESNLFF